MGEMADAFLDNLSDIDELQIRVLGNSNVFHGIVPIPTHCDCGAKLVRRDGPHGPFMGCANFPKHRGRTFSLNPCELSEDEQRRMEDES